ncbi:MAG: alpha-amylase family glycosyl hydrolase [Fermentimonas sp.]|jgi:1,4-alpha-glucan branching enzyme|nr:alpha-amylase family glycosyl hydrolase [Fermentimonas sp.]MDD3512146.1 alpha-amylase family glycosyl hydrolase [Fermentimonas sp.]MDD4285262.1 alpha-amylase family glycosyl hydrolase [Fermentimonas sp.]NLC86905.1 alpha-amylase [Bacteroidales bacterium]
MKFIYNQTAKSVGTAFILLLISFILFSCGDDPVVPPEKPDPKPDEPDTEEPVTLKDWFSWDLVNPDADKELTLYFKAPAESGLYNHKGDVYLYSGIIVEDQWSFNPSNWTDNNSKYKMIPVDGVNNAWSIKLTPTIREWYGSGETPINKLGIIVRSADGTKKGNKDDADFFIENIKDIKYKPFQPAAIKMGAMPSGLEYGINIIDNTSVTLVLFDKDKNGARKDFVHVVGDFNNWTLSNDEKSQMYRDDAAGVWWITITGLDPSKEYAFQYYMGKAGESTFRVADPYSRKILDQHNDGYISQTTYPNLKPFPEGAFGIVSIFKTVDEEFNWQIKDFQIPAKENLIIYELLLRDFTESGDLNGAMEKLDYLESLGVNAIELMPVQEFDGNDSWGYNPAFFFAMDKAYGTDRMYKEFIDECHKRGIAVILDVVYNHATGANPYARMWWNSATNKTTANNPFFNENDPHPYSVFHDFNHEAQIDGNYIVRDFVKRNLKYLLEEYNIDGFRFDLTKGFTQNVDGNKNDDNSAYDASRITILRDYHNTIKSVKPDAHVIFEHFAEQTEEKVLGNAGMLLWHKQINEYSQSAKGVVNGSTFSNGYYLTSSKPSGFQVSYMESHDEERTAYAQLQNGVGPLKTDINARMKQLGTNTAFFLTVPGPKMIWQFGEFGYDISINENGRLGRKPIKWDYLNEPARKELHDTYKTLINLRIEHPELFNSTATFDWKVTPTYWDQGRFMTLSSFGNSKQVVVVGNFTNGTITATTVFPSTGIWYNYMEPAETLNVDSKTMNIEIPANSFRIYSTFGE